ncbi:MAG: hypothetical protein PWP03_441 [Candidatus Woesearchaeota archaeon]|nr:hypothetical protein [Candidatus Woesearchaeota archaeon]
MAKNKPATKEITYVGLYESKELRKSLLTSAKELLILMKDLQVQKIKNKSRIEALKKLENDLKSIDSIGKSIIELLPKSKITLSRTTKAEKRQTDKKMESTEIRNDELSTIDAQIRKIESLLKNI